MLNKLFSQSDENQLSTFALQKVSSDSFDCSRQDVSSDEAESSGELDNKEPKVLTKVTRKLTDQLIDTKVEVSQPILKKMTACSVLDKPSSVMDPLMKDPLVKSMNLLDPSAFLSLSATGDTKSPSLKQLSPCLPKKKKALGK
mmetsp:Transcript_13543/g.21113  ORF Transcript_13543/g.21113 Transcript_13543/m.21113 type:complete len:143 (-) Transcript_13543:8666-9094(-)